ncbi:hypothetical protein M0812_24660 [Anaeramoeba flamelloides]|uniref:Uncharacterized protein n=1 Tax=Anaeramoeba flamelloides TaxID=1746091 RepID=A0AAV7YLE7_9EUKA|nr:hypothetical protein M0812_24660 [Anaeramoeba flamelloides]
MLIFLGPDFLLLILTVIVFSKLRNILDLTPYFFQGLQYLPTPLPTETKSAGFLQITQQKLGFKELPKLVLYQDLRLIVFIATLNFFYWVFSIILSFFTGEGISQICFIFTLVSLVIVFYKLMEVLIKLTRVEKRPTLILVGIVGCVLSFFLLSSSKELIGRNLEELLKEWVVQINKILSSSSIRRSSTLSILSSFKFKFSWFSFRLLISIFCGFLTMLTWYSYLKTALTHLLVVSSRRAFPKIKKNLVLFTNFLMPLFVLLSFSSVITGMFNYSFDQHKTENIDLPDPQGNIDNNQFDLDEDDVLLNEEIIIEEQTINYSEEFYQNASQFLTNLINGEKNWFLIQIFVLLLWVSLQIFLSRTRIQAHLWNAIVEVKKLIFKPNTDEKSTNQIVGLITLSTPIFVIHLFTQSLIGLLFGILLSITYSSNTHSKSSKLSKNVNVLKHILKTTITSPLTKYTIIFILIFFASISVIMFFFVLYARINKPDFLVDTYETSDIPKNVSSQNNSNSPRNKKKKFNKNSKKNKKRK